MPQVFIPPALRRLTDGQSPLDVSAATVREAVDAIERQFPGFRDRISEQGRLKSGISIAVGSRISDLGLLEPVEDNDEIHFVMSVGGG